MITDIITHLFQQWSQITKFMGPTWGPPGSCRPQMGPMLAPWTLLSGIFLMWQGFISNHDHASVTLGIYHLSPLKYWKYKSDNAYLQSYDLQHVLPIMTNKTYMPIPKCYIQNKFLLLCISHTVLNLNCNMKFLTLPQRLRLMGSTISPWSKGRHFSDNIWNQFSWMKCFVFRFNFH